MPGDRRAGAGSRRAGVAAAALVAALAAWASGALILESLTPLASKKLPPGYTLEGNVWHYRDPRVDVQVAPLAGEERASFFMSRGLQNPFASALPMENLILFRLRIENLQKDQSVEFSPTAVILGNSLAFDDTHVYQFLYKEADSETKLAAAGKTMYMNHLSLPAGLWIERLLAFQYDDPYPTKKIPLILGSMSAGPEGLDLVFPYKASFHKEKSK
jgi:hypothetical protein